MAPKALRQHYKALSCRPLIPNIFLWFSPYFQQVAKTTSWSLLHVCCQICGLTSVGSPLNNMLALYDTALPWSTNIRCVAIHLIFLSQKRPIIESWTKPRNMHSPQEHYCCTQFYIIRKFKAYHYLCMYTCDIASMPYILLHYKMFMLYSLLHLPNIPNPEFVKHSLTALNGSFTFLLVPYFTLPVPSPRPAASEFLHKSAYRL